VLPGNRVLIAEYGSRRVTERDSKGTILWEVNVPAAPINVQRLANGNTFIAFYNSGVNSVMAIEVDRTGKTVDSINMGPQMLPAGPGGGFVGASTLVTGGHKMADGQMVFITIDGLVMHLDATGKEIKRFSVPVSNSGTIYAIMGNIDVTNKGHLIVALNDSSVAEYDLEGKMVWQSKAQVNRATRLPNGNTLVASLNGGVVELDSSGRTVWQYTPPIGYQTMRARRQ
jgi:outer membrane protein assembly factor BamB